MAQEDFNIANQTFPSFRSDLNNNLEALATNSSGATSPTTTFAGMFWYDTTAGIMKIRNASDNGWNDLWAIDDSGDFGVGTNSPQQPFHFLINAASGYPSFSGAFPDVFLVEGSGNTLVEILSNNTTTCGFSFADPDGNIRGGVFYLHTTDVLDLRIEGKSAIIVDGDPLVLGSMRPDQDNTMQLGTLSTRWTEVFATNGTINTSDKNMKKDIKDCDLGLDFLLSLRPVSFSWNAGNDARVHYGFLAQDIEESANSLGYDSDSFGPLTIRDGNYGLTYSELIPSIVKAVSDLNERILSLEEST